MLTRSAAAEPQARSRPAPPPAIHQCSHHACVPPRPEPNRTSHLVGDIHHISVGQRAGRRVRRPGPTDCDRSGLRRARMAQRAHHPSAKPAAMGAGGALAYSGPQAERLIVVCLPAREPMVARRADLSLGYHLLRRLASVQLASVETLVLGASIIARPSGCCHRGSTHDELRTPPGDASRRLEPQTRRIPHPSVAATDVPGCC